MEKSNSSIQIVHETHQKEWDTIVSHPLQTWAWGNFRKKMGVDIVRLGVVQNGKLTDAWQISFHRIPHTPWTIGYFPKGPMPTDQMMDALRDIARKKHAIYIQLEPNVIRNAVDQRSTINDQLIPSHHPLFTKYTFVLDMAKSEDELLANMHPKTRYNIKLALKHGVTISEDNSNNALETYLTLTQETLSRQGFYAHSRMYHETMFKILHASGMAKLWIATYQGKPITAWVIFCWKDTIYYPYGASTRMQKNVMAPNLMLWGIVKWGKSQGYKKFDLWGAMGPDPDQSDPWYGFHRFKEGYHPQLVEFVGSFDLVIHPLLYKGFIMADSLRWTWLGLKGKLHL